MDGWQNSTIGATCEVVNGGTPKTGVATYWDGPHQWITPAEMGRRETPYIGRTARTITDAGIASSSAQLLPPHSVILSSRAPIGHLVINTTPMATNQGCKGLVPSPILNYKFLYYYLLGNVDLLNELGTGATFKELSGGKLKEVSIAVPPLAEQRHIVFILDEALEAIKTAKENKERNLENARDLFRSYRETLLSGTGDGWSEAPLSKLCHIKHGYAFEGEFFAQDGEYVLLTPGNYFESGGYRDRGEKQKYFTGNIPIDYILSEGDLLVAMTEQAAGLLGSPLLVPESDRFLHNQRLGLVVGKAGAVWANDFFFHVFNLARVRREIHASASGVKVRHTSPGKIGEVQVRFPETLAKQRELAGVLNKISADCDQLAETYRRKVDALDKLKKSLLHQAFTGQLTAKSADKQLAEVA